jgi:hypothetical protein
MENERVIIATDSKTLRKVLNDFFNQASESNSVPDFEDDRLTQTQASKLAGISIPTLKKSIRAGKFKEYEIGRKRYLLKSELLQALRTTTL